MLIVRKRSFYFIFAVFSLILIALSFFAYYVINNIDNYTMEQRKFYSENIIYVTLIFIIAVSFLLIYIYVRSIKVFAELDKINESVKYGNYDSDILKKRLGRLGQEIGDLFGHINDVSRKKTSKISSLSEVCKFLFDNIDLSLFVIDVQGLVLFVSQMFLDDYSVGKNDFLYHNIDEFGILDYKDIILKLNSTHDLLTVEDKNMSFFEKEIHCHLHFYPICNNKQELSNVIVAVSPHREVKYNNMIVSKTHINGSVQTHPKFFNGFFGKKS